MVAAAGLLFCPTCNQVWTPGSEEQHSPLQHLSCDLCPVVLSGGLKDTMVLHRWRAHDMTGVSNPGVTFQPFQPILSGNPSSTSHCSSTASTTTSTSGSPRTEKNLKRKLEKEGEDDRMFAVQDCTEVRKNAIKEELERCRKAQEGGSSKKKYMTETDVIQDNNLSHTSKQGPGVGEGFCHDRKANETHVEPLEDGEIDISDDSRVEVMGGERGWPQMMPCNKVVKEDVPYWCNVCNVRLPEDTPKVRRMHNRGKRHQAALQERRHQATHQQIRCHEHEKGGDDMEIESLQFRISNDGKTTLSALARLGDKRSVVFVPKDRRNVVARLGEKVLELTPQRKVEFLEDQQEQEMLTDKLSEQLSYELDEELGGDLRDRLRNRSLKYRNFVKDRTYQDLDKVETSKRIIVEKKVEDYGKELEELSTKIQKARYKERVKNSKKKDEVINCKRVVTFARKGESLLADVVARGQAEKISSERYVRSENTVKITKGDERKKIVWP